MTSFATKGWIQCQLIAAAYVKGREVEIFHKVWPVRDSLETCFRYYMVVIVTS